jgi:pimeloyl-ACP methyl ester carboxylesterase
MAQDTALLVQKLNIENADFFGYSMGAGIALELAMR